MATIPNSQKFHTLAGTVETENRGSAALNAQRTIYTMQDILDTVTVGGGVDGSGTAGKISKWIDANTVGDSIMAETAALITVTGGLTASADINSANVTASAAVAARRSRCRRQCAGDRDRTESRSPRAGRAHRRPGSDGCSPPSLATPRLPWHWVPAPPRWRKA